MTSWLWYAFAGLVLGFLLHLESQTRRILRLLARVDIASEAETEAGVEEAETEAEVETEAKTEAEAAEVHCPNCRYVAAETVLSSGRGFSKVYLCSTVLSAGVAQPCDVINKNHDCKYYTPKRYLD